MSADNEPLPPAWGCGWKYRESRCASLNCRRKSACEGNWADRIFEIVTNWGIYPGIGNV